MIELRMQDGAVLLPAKVVPGASRTRFMGEWQGRAKIAVSAAAEKGKANDALVQFLAKMLDVRVRDVSIISGESNPLKTIRIAGASLPHVRDSLKLERS